MKSIPNVLTGIFLGLLLAGGIWLAVRPPQGQNVVLPPPSTVTVFVPEKKQAVEAVSENSPAPAVTHQPENVNTTVPEPGIATATPDAKAYSCADEVVGSGTFVWPAENHFLTGNDYGPAHPGIDIAAGEGSPVYAADAGVVIGQGNDEAGYGNVIEIDHHNGYVTLYAHLSLIGVSMCQRVEAGQWIGAAGSTGNARGAHLHFGIAQDGHYINPWTVLP